MLNGPDILPTYTDYFGLTPARVGLGTAASRMRAWGAGLVKDFY